MKNEMQYFVSIENNAYSRWQAELLIESFKYHGLEDRLLIVIAENKHNDIPEFTKNIRAHKRKFVLSNFGDEYKPLNKTRSLIWAIEQGHLRQPFVLLHPDMLLFKPIERHKESLVYDANPVYLDELKPLITDKVKDLVRNAQYEWFSWIPLGDTMIFNKDVPLVFFRKAHLELESLVKEFGSVRYLEKAAWLLTIYKEIALNPPSKLTLTGKFLEQNFHSHNQDKPIIHYRHGIESGFNKYQYLYEPPMFLALNEFNPFDAIYENNVTSATNFAYDLIERYRN